MEAYQKEIFDFFSVEDNFRSMYKVARHYDSMRKKLLHDFWDLVESKLKELNTQNGNKWCFKRLEKLESNISKLLMYKPHWHSENNTPLVAVAYEGLTSSWLFWGLFINNNARSYNIDQIRQYSRNLSAAKRAEFDKNNWWGFWHNAGVDFSNPEELVKILPSNRDDLASSFANNLYNLGLELEDDMETMAKMRV